MAMAITWGAILQQLPAAVEFNRFSTPAVALLNILKIILGGVVAVVSAFGITITVFFVLAVAETAHSPKGNGARCSRRWFGGDSA
jgi:hypothetical protein